MNKTVLTLGRFPLMLILIALVFNTPQAIWDGYIRILLSPSILITDYMVIGNLGSAFLNAGLMMSISLWIVVVSKTPITGSVIAALFTVAGFSLFGKNIFNIWPILLGVYLYAKSQREPFSNFTASALFATAFSPMVSQIVYGFGLPWFESIPLSVFMGTSAGFVFVPLAKHFMSFHQGFNLYNGGFTAGIIGMIYMALLRSFGFNNTPAFHVAEGVNLPVGLFLLTFFGVMLIMGIRRSQNIGTSLLTMHRSTSKSGTDFLKEVGVGPTFINMAILGLISTTYVLVIGAELNGPSLGGIFTVVGFGAIGKHPRTILPVMLGVFLATRFMIWDTSAPASVLATLFSTTLAPISGVYGPVAGLVAGFFHMIIVMNVGILHGGMNLYNNGFAGGFVAAFFVPIVEALRKAMTLRSKSNP